MEHKVREEFNKNAKEGKAGFDTSHNRFATEILFGKPTRKSPEPGFMHRPVKKREEPVSPPVKREKTEEEKEQTKERVRKMMKVAYQPLKKITSPWIRDISQGQPVRLSRRNSS